METNNQTNQTPNRHQRRAQKASQRPAKASPEHGVRIQALEQTVERLTQAFNANQQNLQQAFHAVDAHIWVIQKLGKDIVDNTVPRDADNSVDFPTYYERFNAAVRDAAAAQVPVVSVPTTEEPHVEAGQE